MKNKLKLCKCFMIILFQCWTWSLRYFLAFSHRKFTMTMVPLIISTGYEWDSVIVFVIIEILGYLRIIKRFLTTHFKKFHKYVNTHPRRLVGVNHPSLSPWVIKIILIDFIFFFPFFPCDWIFRYIKICWVMHLYNIKNIHLW